MTKIMSILAACCLFSCTSEVQPSVNFCDISLLSPKTSIKSLDGNFSPVVEGPLAEYIPKCCTAWEAQCGGDVLTITCRDHEETWSIENISDDGGFVTSVVVTDGTAKETYTVLIHPSSQQ